MANFFDEVRKNKIKSYILILFFFLFVLFVGAVVGYYYVGDPTSGPVSGILFATFVGGIYFLFAWFTGSNMVLSMTGAKEVTRKEFPFLLNTVEGLALAAGVPTPKAYVINDTALNAFATGRDPKHAAITVTTGLLKKLNRQELEGVIAHEMSHIKNFDIRYMLLATVLVGILTLISDFILRSFLWGGGRRNKEGGSALIIALGLLLAILSPLIGHLMRLALSRKREFLADANGALLTRYPPGLASALRKISKDPDPLVDRANKATAHLFISTPFRKRKQFFAKAFATHPPIEERIKRLEAM